VKPTTGVGEGTQGGTRHGHLRIAHRGAGTPAHHDARDRAALRRHSNGGDDSDGESETTQDRRASHAAPPREKRLPILPAPGNVARAQALLARWRAALWNDMFPNSISVGARMPVRFLALVLLSLPVALPAPRTQKPPLHGRHWVAITGKPLAATAGGMIFQKGGNPVDAACAMLAAVTTMWDVLSWGGETQALIYNPQTKKVIAINALGVAPTGATPAFYRSKGMRFPPQYGAHAAITPG